MYVKLDPQRYQKKEYNLQNRSVIIYIDFFYEDYT